jgi:Flp pilus assembly protein TadD
LAAALLLLSAAAWPRQAASPPIDSAAAAARERTAARCRAYPGLDACSDAVRWNPGDPALLVALADALARANRPADAIRYYRSAAEIAPNMRGVADKIAAAEVTLRKRSRNPAGNRPQTGHFTNAAPEGQSH